MRILARYQNMASSEILAMVPASEHERIKESDSKPIYKAYIIGHEGESQGKVIGTGTVVARWFKSAIENLVAKIQFGLKIFHDHREGTNDHAGRISIGEVVGKGVKIIKDRLSAVAVVYIKPEFRHLPLDVASIEANVNFTGDQPHDVYSAEVEDISGIALGNSAVNVPGFAGATLLAQVQAFAAKIHTTQYGSAGGNMTIEEIREFLKANPLRPSDLFGAESLLADSVVKGLIDSERKAASAGEFAHRKREEETFDKKKVDYEAKIKDLESQNSAKDLMITKAKVPTLFEKIAAERKLSDQQKKFIFPKIEKFAPTKPDTLETEFGKFIDDQIGEFKTTAEVFGFKIEEPQTGTGGNGGGKPSGSEPVTRTGGAGPVPDEYLDPSKNPMIPAV